MRSLVVLVLVAACGHPPPSPAPVSNAAVDPPPDAAVGPVRTWRPAITSVDDLGSDGAIVTLALGSADEVHKHAIAKLRAHDGRELGWMMPIRIDEHDSIWRAHVPAGVARAATIVVEEGPPPAKDGDL